MQNPTQKEINEKREWLANLNKAITKAEDLKKALADYDKATINKKFFEKYFTRLDEKGEVLKGWKGELYTSFSFSAPTYNFEKGKKIYIDGSYSITDIETNDRQALLTIVSEWITKERATFANIESQVTTLTAFDENAFISDLKALWLKYNKPNHWRKLLEDNFYLND